METSNCCDARIIHTDICSECGEHADIIEEQSHAIPLAKNKVPWTKEDYSKHNEIIND